MTIPSFTVVLAICIAAVLYIDDSCGHITERAETAAVQAAEAFTTTTVTTTQLRSVAVWYAETLSELETAEYEELVTVEHEVVNGRWIFGEVYTDAEMSASGRAVAGTSINGIRIVGNSESATIHVYLETPKFTGFYFNKVHNFTYPGSNWQTHHERITATTDAYFSCLTRAKEEINQNALDNGILERSRENTESFFRELESLPFGTGRVTVEFHWGQQPPLNNQESTNLESRSTSRKQIVSTIAKGFVQPDQITRHRNR